MTIDNKIRYEKRQYNINKEAEKISALPFNITSTTSSTSSTQREIIEQATFEYSPSVKAFGKQRKKQVTAIKSVGPFNKFKQIDGIFPQGFMNDLIRAKLKEIVELQDIIKKDDLTYK